VLLLYSGVMSAVSPLGGYVSDRLGRATPVGVGTLLLLVGTGCLLWAGADTSLLGLTASLAVGAAGVGLQVGAEQSAALESAPREMTGAAGGVWATSRYLGSILGSVLLGLMVGGGLDPSGFQRVLSVVAGASLLLVPVGAVLRLSGRPLGLLAEAPRRSGVVPAPTRSIPDPG
jgi:MFS family permease